MILCIKKERMHALLSDQTILKSSYKDCNLCVKFELNWLSEHRNIDSVNKGMDRQTFNHKSSLQTKLQGS